MKPPEAVLIPANPSALVYRVPIAEAGSLEFWLHGFGFKTERKDEGQQSRIVARPCACPVCAGGRRTRLAAALETFTTAKTEARKAEKRERAAATDSGAKFFQQLREQLANEGGT